MITATSALLLALVAGAGDGRRPHCPNRVVNEVVRRAGCTVGDLRCWYRSGGFCYDWVERRVLESLPGKADGTTAVAAGEVAPGDVAVFVASAHYAYVERVVRDAAGRPVAVDLSEYNFGSCWVDEDAMVTETYGVPRRRAGVPLSAVDGGFLRPRRAAR